MADNALWAPYTSLAERAESTSRQQTEISKRSNDELDKNAFLMLLITQMKYQDPLNPVEDKEFIAQMAQFSALEQMQNLNATMTNSQTFSMVGKYIAAQVYNDQTGTYTDVAGRVDSVMMMNKTPYLMIGEQTVLVSEVTDVFEDEYQLSLQRAQASNAFAAQNINLIGKTIQAITYDADKKPTGFVEGVVEYVKLVEGTPVLVVGNKDIYPSELIAVSDDKMLIGRNVMVSGQNEDGEEVFEEFEVKNVEIDGESAYLVLDGKKIEIAKIDTVTEALKFIGKEATIKDSYDTYMINGVTIKEKVPYLVTEDGKTVAFSSVKR